MSGETSGTGGGRAGTSGDRLPWRRLPGLWSFLAAFLAFACAINITSVLIEHPPERRNFQVWEPVLWEVSSVVAILTLFPCVWMIYWRLHWRWRPLWLALSSH